MCANFYIMLVINNIEVVSLKWHRKLFVTCQLHFTQNSFTFMHLQLFFSEFFKIMTTPQD